MEEGILLERPLQALLGQEMRRGVCYLLPIQEDPSPPFDEVGDGVVAGALAGAVGADDPENLACANTPAHLVESDEGTIGDPKALDAKNRSQTSGHLATLSSKPDEQRSSGSRS